MLNGSFAQIILITLLVVTFITAGAHLITSLVYEFGLAKFRNKLRKHPYARTLRARPLVSVVIRTGGYEDKLARCLASLAAGSYRKYEVVILSKGPSPAVKNLVEDFSGRHPSKEIRLVSPRIEKMNSLVRYHTKGELIFFLNDDDLLQKNTILNGVKYFLLHKEVAALVPTTIVLPNYSLPNLIEQFESLIKNQWQKSRFAIVKKAKVLQTSAFYRRRALSSASHSNGKHTMHCYSDMVISTSSPKSSLGLADGAAGSYLLGTALRILILAEASYGLYLAQAHHYSRLLLIMWAGGTFYLAYCVNGASPLGFFKKLRMTLLAPLACGLLYIWGLVHLIAFRPSLASSKLIGKYTGVDFVAPLSSRT